MGLIDIWTIIPLYPDYEISNGGEVRDSFSGTVLPSSKVMTSCGEEEFVALRHKGGRICVTIEYILEETF